MAPDVVFPRLGITINRLNNVAFSIFGIDCYYYGILIAVGILCGYMYGINQVKKTGQDVNFYSDFLIIGVVSALIGARLYYVIFEWESYREDLLKIFAIKEGGLAIYGGIIGAVVSCYVYTKIKKFSFIKFLDTTIASLLVGQAIGRWGNFFNMEVFGDYTNSFLAMQLKVDKVSQSDITSKMLDNPVFINGVQYIQVHPTFLYESLWNIMVLLFIGFYRKHKAFEGEIICLYFLGYGLGRFWIEGIRTDQLKLFGTGIPVSQLLSLLFVIASIAVILFMRLKKPLKSKPIDFPLDTEENNAE